MFRTIADDLRRKALWCYQSDRWTAVLKVLLTDGTPAMILYRLMQASRRLRLTPLEMAFNRANTICCQCTIGRGAEFGPGLVLIHSHGVFINGSVRGGSGVSIEHQVTVGAEGRRSPVLGSGVFLGAGAKVVGPVTIGDGARIGANAVVVHDVPPYATAVGVPARVVSRREHRTDAPTSVPRPAASALDPPLTSPGVTASCGVEIELIENMPPADDHWASPFYRTNFAPSEIADCLRREAPAPHFAARWCAKEALKKCDPAFLTREMSQIEVVSDGASAPYLVHHVGGTARRLPHAVSLSHTPRAAMAVVIMIEAPPAAPSSAPLYPPVAPLPPPQAEGRRSSLLSLIVSLAALALAVLALYRSPGPGR